MDSSEIKSSVMRINDRIHSSRRTFILAAAYPGALAVNYQEDMFQMNKPVLIQPVIPSILNDLEGITEEDYVILATVSGSLYRLNPMRENALKHFRNMAIITAESTDTSSFKDALTIRLPQTKDDEKYNWFLMVFWQMMKHDYYARYGMRC
jgi:DNA-binding MurR/RpiR family transcriptional regulator